MNLKSTIIFIITYIVILSPRGVSQSQTVGLFLNSPSAYDGYTLFAPMAYTKSYLINNAGELVHTWSSEQTPVGLVYLLDNGNLLRPERVENNYFVAGGSGGKIKILDWEGNIIWSYKYSTDSCQLHHDAKMLPNGNVLMTAWEKKSVSIAIEAGRDPALLPTSEFWPDHIIEVKPKDSVSGEIVWQWHVWDHLIQDFDSAKQNYGIVEDHPELINLNFEGFQGVRASWNHSSAIDYNSSLDQILISSNAFKEIWIIDHSTTTTQAASHTGGNSGKGGDLLYRWGNPRTYNKGTLADQKLFGVHAANWIKAGLRGEGNILMLNNGLGRTGGNYSSVEEIKSPIDSSGKYLLDTSGVFGPTQTIWTYKAQPPNIFYSQNVSGATRVPNGNTLICYGPKGTFFELDSNDSLVWKYINPVTSLGPLYQSQQISLEANIVSKITKYSPTFSGFHEKILTPMGPIELYPLGIKDNEKEMPLNYYLSQNYPNPFNPSTIIQFNLKESGKVDLAVYNILGEKIATLINEFREAGKHTIKLDATQLVTGIYVYRIKVNDFMEAKKLMVLR